MRICKICGKKYTIFTENFGGIRGVCSKCQKTAAKTEVQEKLQSVLECPGGTAFECRAADVGPIDSRELVQSEFGFGIDRPALRNAVVRVEEGTLKLFVRNMDGDYKKAANIPVERIRRVSFDSISRRKTLRQLSFKSLPIGSCMGGVMVAIAIFKLGIGEIVSNLGLFLLLALGLFVVGQVIGSAVYFLLNLKEVWKDRLWVGFQLDDSNCMYIAIDPKRVDDVKAILQRCGLEVS